MHPNSATRVAALLWILTSCPSIADNTAQHVEMRTCLEGVGGSNWLYFLEDAGYNRAKETRNLAWSGKTLPFALVYPGTAEEIVAVIKCRAAAPATIPVCGRSGRHGWESYCDGGIVVDLSNMSAMVVDPASQSALIGAGVNHGVAYSALVQGYNLTFPGAHA